jgi:hypothetical protein
LIICIVKIGTKWPKQGIEDRQTRVGIMIVPKAHLINNGAAAPRRGTNLCNIHASDSHLNFATVQTRGCQPSGVVIVENPATIYAIGL